MLARETFDGLHTCGTTGEHTRKIAAQDGRDERGFEVRSLKFSELRTANFELRIAPFSPVSRQRNYGGWHRILFLSRCLKLDSAGFGHSLGSVKDFDRNEIANGIVVQNHVV